MGWRINIESRAKSDLRALGFPNDRDIIGYLYRQIAPNEDPRRVGGAHDDLWRYETNGMVIEVKIVEGVGCAWTAPDDAAHPESVRSEPTILVLAVWRGDQAT
jgi:hypothetical protein